MNKANLLAQIEFNFVVYPVIVIINNLPST